MFFPVPKRREKNGAYIKHFSGLGGACHVVFLVEKESGLRFRCKGVFIYLFFFFSLVTLTGINGWSGLGEILFYYGRAGSWLAYGLFVLLRRGGGVGLFFVCCLLI